VPWAETDETTTLLTEAETVATLRRARLHKLAWDDVSELAKGWIVGQKRQLQQPAQAGATTGPKLSPELVVGARMQSMVANFGRNIMEDRVRLVMGICEAA
jgi:hypothetical protein